MTMVLSGQYDKDEFLSYPDLILEKWEKENVRKVLVDGLGLRGTNIPIIDRFFIAQNIANALRGKVRVAVVWPKEHI